MKLLVTGALGFIGSHFVKLAKAKGAQVRALDSLTYAGRSANLPSDFRWHQADICDYELMAYHLREGQPDFVVNLAAETHVARSIESRDEFLQTNVLGTHALLDACKYYWERGKAAQRLNFRYLQVSTDEVYGSLGETEPSWTELSPYAPNNPYAASKAAGDHLVRSYYRTFSLPTIVTHCANNYGPRQHPEKLIPSLLRARLAGLPMVIHGDGQHVRDWIHVDDHCEGLWKALMRGKPGETYDFAGSCERTNYQVAQLVESLTPGGPQGPEAAYEFTRDRLGNDRRYSTCSWKALKELGWSDSGPIESKLYAVVEWYINNQDYAETYGS